MKVLSIDVGIKNLAFCLFEKNQNDSSLSILKWDTINLAEDKLKHACTFQDAKRAGICCTNDAKFMKGSVYFCSAHSKKKKNGMYNPPAACLKPAFIKKQSIKALRETAAQLNIAADASVKKAALIDIINTHVRDVFLEEMYTQKAAGVDLIKIGQNIKLHFDALFGTEECIDYLIIENQIGPLAVKMKTIQGMLVQYFIMSTVNVSHIEFISAGNKLKDFEKDLVKDLVKVSDVDSEAVTTYADRKKMGVSKCFELISNHKHHCEQYADYFKSHLKKDDLADSFLQGIWFLRHKLGIEYINENITSATVA